MSDQGCLAGVRYYRSSTARKLDSCCPFGFNVREVDDRLLSLGLDHIVDDFDFACHRGPLILISCRTVENACQTYLLRSQGYTLFAWLHLAVFVLVVLLRVSFDRSSSRVGDQLTDLADIYQRFAFEGTDSHSTGVGKLG